MTLLITYVLAYKNERMAVYDDAECTDLKK